MSLRIKLGLAVVVLAALLALAGLGGATQYVADSLHHARRLGAPLAVVAGTPVYRPWAWLEWQDRFGSAAPRVFAVAQAITFGASLAAFGVLLATVVRLRSAASSTAHGSATWASLPELRKSGLLEPNGVVLCQTDDARFSSAPDGKGGLCWKMKRAGRLVRHDGPEHVFVFAPTRSGKGIGIVIPTLLSWNRSVLVYDIKKELWTATAGWRRSFSRCWRFEPTAPDSVRFNPLMEIRRGAAEVKDAQNIADILIDPEGASERRDHWQQTAHTLLVGAILHVLHSERDKSLTGVAAFLSDPGRSQLDTLGRMLTTNHTPAGPHQVIAQTAQEMMNKADKELSSVFSTAMACLGLYRDPIIARNTRASDFQITDLMQLDAPVSLYLVVPPSDIDRTRPLMRLMLSQIGRRLTEKMEFDGSGYRHRLLLMLDEFPSLGRLSFFEAELPYLAGYGIKCFLIAQSLNQIEKVYGPNNAILDNCHIRVTYNALDERTAKRISELLGQSTLLKTQRSVSGTKWWSSRVSHSEQEYARPLLMPDEILRLPYDEALLLVGGVSPYRARKLMYYLDDRFRDRAWLPVPTSPRAIAAELPRQSAQSGWSNPVVTPDPRPIETSDPSGAPAAPAGARVPSAPKGGPVPAAPAGAPVPSAPVPSSPAHAVTASSEPLPTPASLVEAWKELRPATNVPPVAPAPERASSTSAPVAPAPGAGGVGGASVLKDAF